MFSNLYMENGLVNLICMKTFTCLYIDWQFFANLINPLCPYCDKYENFKIGYVIFGVLYGNDSNQKNKDKINLQEKILTKVVRNAVDGICGISNKWNFNSRSPKHRHLN